MPYGMSAGFWHHEEQNRRLSVPRERRQVRTGLAVSHSGPELAFHVDTRLFIVVSPHIRADVVLLLLRPERQCRDLGKNAA